MNKTSETLPENMTRVLIKIDGIFEFAYYKDGMFGIPDYKTGVGATQITPDKISHWLSIKDLRTMLFKHDIAERLFSTQETGIIKTTK